MHHPLQRKKKTFYKKIGEKNSQKLKKRISKASHNAQPPDSQDIHKLMQVSNALLTV